MIQLFRKFFSSKFGIAITLGFLALIAFAFASMDISSTGVFGGVSGGDRVAVVGKERIDAAELSTAATNALDQARQTDPTITMQAFIARGGLEEVLRQLIDRTAIAEFARRHGMRAGDRLVDSELLQIPAFRGPDGNFDQNAFRAALAQRGLSESAVRNDLAMGLLARQLLTPISFSPVVPRSVAERYASLLRERREGSIVFLPATSFAPQGAPTEAQLQAFYNENRDRYIRPERRVIRYATFGPDAVGAPPAPTAAQISERFQRDRAQYAASERRRFTQLVVPTQDAAEAIVAEVRGGKSLDVAAREKGLATTSVGPVTQDELARSASAAAAQAAFSAQQGAIAQPARGGLGWYVLRVDEVDRQPARTLQQVRDEIAAALAVEQRQAALDDLTARIDEEIESGRSLSEVAQELDITVAVTRPATADGRIYGTNETVAPVLASVLPVAFDMDEGEPQLAVVAPGESYVIFDVSNITPSATAPLAEIREDVTADWRRDTGANAARAAADRILDRVTKGSTLAAAVAAENKGLPTPQTLNLNREQLAQQGRVPAELALFFSMARGTVKKLEAPGDAGWHVVRLDSIDAPQIAGNDPIVASTMRELGQASGTEYVDQFVKAAQREVGVERNDAAIRAIAAQLTGQQN
ncbi:MAG TPA: peptidyl-prolyl cis-trans isomerase [Croceibacterium sp.]|nr:peptidyl-prolyl cis-trans isomerase [Croceibacterium sp.]